MQLYGENISEIIDKRIIILEKDLIKCEDYAKLVQTKNFFLMNLKSKMINIDWVEFDNYICADNAQTDYLINFFYCKGLNDGIKLPATLADGQLY